MTSRVEHEVQTGLSLRRACGLWTGRRQVRLPKTLVTFTTFVSQVIDNSGLTSDKADGDVRLVRGSNDANGLLMVYHGYRWQYVCRRGSNIQTLGQVVCKNMNRIFESASGPVTYRYSSSSFWLSGVNCRGDEANLAQCTHSDWGYSYGCSDRNYVKVTCRPGVCDSAHCDMGCINNPDNLTYTCTCTSGYTLNSDGRTCAEVDECLVDNGGCSHICLNTVGSYQCKCPHYLYLSTDQHTCTAVGISVGCSQPQGMTAVLDRKSLFYLPEKLTLTDTSCTSQSNSTHIWLYAPYGGCSTVQKVSSDKVTYSNVILDAKTSSHSIKFFESIQIPFKCSLTSTQTIHDDVSVSARRTVVMRVDSTGPLLDGSMQMLDGDEDDSKKMTDYTFSGGEVAYVKMSPKMEGLSVEPHHCEVFSKDRTESYTLITNGRRAKFPAKVLPSNQFRFSYPVFVFGTKGRQLHLECNASVSIRNSLVNFVGGSLLVTKEELQQLPAMSHHEVIDPSRGVTLDCGLDVMKLTLDLSVTRGIKLDRLQPLKKNCAGFSVMESFGEYTCTIPLTGCGADISNEGMLKVTNSLVYPSSMNASERGYTNVTLTVGCGFDAASYLNTLTYTVNPSSFSIGGVENKDKAFFDVSLNVFSDDKFTKQLTNGGSISMAEGRHLFGDIGVTNGNPNRKVALNECKVTPTNNLNDPNSQVVIENGCKTSHGARVFSPNRFSVVSKLFSANDNSRLFIHCSVIVCDGNNAARCERTCHSASPSDSVIGKRDLELSSHKQVHVVAGPFQVR